MGSNGGTGQVILFPLELTAVMQDIRLPLGVAPIGNDADMLILAENDDIPRLPLICLFDIKCKRYGILFKKDAQINFLYKERSYSIIIDKVMVFPQAYAAVVPQSSMIVNTPRIFIVDIGGYTTDVLLLKNGKLDFQFCRSLESGSAWIPAAARCAAALRQSPI